MFIFATTEPDKVIGTIRSRTHHYPFRLVPQEVMGPYLETICEKESIKPEPGVLKLAMRAGGGSMRDTLSVLDQLMVGSVEGVITHDAAVALLGFTPEALIGEAIDAVIDHNGESLYGVIQKVVVGGFDPRRFVEDLLARVRDLLVLTLAGDRAESVLSDTAEAEDMDDLHRQAKALGLSALTAIADIINTTLGAMTGAISPRMRLELLAARLLAGSENGFVAPAAAPALGAPAPATGAVASAAPATRGAAGGFAGASRGGFVGASHGGFAGAARNQAQTQTAPAAAAPAAPASPATNAAAPSSDSRSTDEKWNAAVAALPQAIREYVTRDKVPTVAFGPNRKGLPCLSMTFDKPLSQHAFALAVDNSGKKAAIVVMDAVRQEFGADAVIAPAAVAANGERVESVKRLSPEQLAKVKQQIAMAKAGLAASSLGAGLGMHSGSEPKAQKPAAEGNAEDADGSHRASGVTPGGTSNKPDLDDDDPWAKPAASSEAMGEPSASAGEPSVDGFAPSNPDPASAQAPEERHKKHVAVPDMSDDVDPWATPAAPVAHAQDATANTQAGQAEQSTASTSSNVGAPAADPAVPTASADPWNQPVPPPAEPMGGPWNQPAASAPQAAPDPWNQPAPPQSEPDPWNQPQGQAQRQTPSQSQGMPQSQNSGAADPWNQPMPPSPQPQVAAEDDEYSMSDQSLGDATAMKMDDLKKLFEVKKVEEFAADDPKNPKNIQPAKKHTDD